MTTETDFSVGQSVIWPFATRSACFLVLFHGWLFGFITLIPIIWIIYRSWTALLVFLVGAAIVAACQLQFDVQPRECWRWIKGFVNPRIRAPYRPPPRWPHDGWGSL